MASGFWLLASGGFASLAFTPDKKERSWTGSSAARTGVKKQGLGTPIVPRCKGRNYSESMPAMREKMSHQLSATLHRNGGRS